MDSEVCESELRLAWDRAAEFSKEWADYNELYTPFYPADWALMWVNGDLAG